MNEATPGSLNWLTFKYQGDLFRKRMLQIDLNEVLSAKISQAKALVRFSANVPPADRLFSAVCAA
jgi:hypothetical protein